MSARRALGDWGWPLLVAGAAVALYLPTLGYGFLNVDDDIYVLHNPWIRELTLANLVRIATEPYFSNFLPVHLLSYAFDHALFGLGPFGYHLHSLCLHAINSALVLVVLQQLGARRPVAVVAALLFALHPAHAESVAWISSRKDLLSMAFALVSLWAHLRARRDGGRTRSFRALSFVAYVLAVFSKTVVVLLPLFLLLCDLLDARGANERPPARLWRALRGQLPFLAVAAVAIALNDAAQARTELEYARDPAAYLLVKGHALWRYLGLLAGVFPGQPAYDLPRVGAGEPARLEALAAIATAAALGGFAALTRSRALGLALAWMFLMLLPPLAFPLVSHMADRYLYAPSAAACWLFAETASRAAHRAAPGPGTLRRAIFVALSLALASHFTLRSVRAVAVFRNDELLWSYALRYARSTRVHNLLARELIAQRRFDEAEEILRRSVASGDPSAFASLATLHNRLGRYPEALEQLNRGLAACAARGCTDSQRVELYIKRGRSLWSLREYDRCRSDWQAALALDPANRMARRHLEQLRRLPAAVRPST